MCDIYKNVGSVNLPKNGFNPLTAGFSDMCSLYLKIRSTHRLIDAFRYRDKRGKVKNDGNGNESLT